MNHGCIGQIDIPESLTVVDSDYVYGSCIVTDPSVRFAESSTALLVTDDANGPKLFW